MRPIMNFKLSAGAKSADPWVASFPNPADFPFNYYHLLQLASSNQNAIGQAPKPNIASP